MLGSELASLHQTFFFWCLPKWRESRVFLVLEIKQLVSVGAFGLDTGSFLLQMDGLLSSSMRTGRSCGEVDALSAAVA